MAEPGRIEHVKLPPPACGHKRSGPGVRELVVVCGLAAILILSLSARGAGAGRIERFKGCDPGAVGLDGFLGVDRYGGVGYWNCSNALSMSRGVG